MIRGSKSITIDLKASISMEKPMKKSFIIVALNGKYFIDNGGDDLLSYIA